MPGIPLTSEWAVIFIRKPACPRVQLEVANRMMNVVNKRIKEIPSGAISAREVPGRQRHSRQHLKPFEIGPGSNRLVSITVNRPTKLLPASCRSSKRKSN
jgi:hypothetical protein